jgi:hypothetical protein
VRWTHEVTAVDTQGTLGIVGDQLERMDFHTNIDTYIILQRVYHMRWNTIEGDDACQTKMCPNFSSPNKSLSQPPLLFSGIIRTWGLSGVS